MRSRCPAVVPLLAAALLACGGSSSYGGGSSPSPTPTPSPSPSGAPTLVIQGLAFVPQSLDVPAGAVVTVHNMDSMEHSVTSESAAGVFRPGGVAGVSFDTGPFFGTSSFTIPVSAPVGTVIPYFCSIHLGTMRTPNGQIRVVAAAATAATPTGSAPAAPMSPY